MKIALVDDEIVLGELFKEIFTSDLIDVEFFSSPFEALKSKEKFDIYFLDYRMPGMLGDELAHKLPNVPKYLITGEIDVKSTFKFKKTFFKPYDVETIMSLLEKHVQKRNK